MKRHLLRLVLFLLLGAIVNIAVAWGCSYWVLPRYTKTVPMQGETFWGKERAEQSLKEIDHAVSLWKGFGINEHCLLTRHRGRLGLAGTGRMVKLVGEAPLPIAALDDALTGICQPNALSDNLMLRQEISEIWHDEKLPLLRVDAGWPLQSLSGWGPASPQIRSNNDGTALPNSVAGDRAIVVQRAARGRTLIRLLPLRPLWPGFAINTLFYAAIMWGGWLLFAAPFALRRHLRIKRGLCPACAYDLRGAPPKHDKCPECGMPTPSPAGSRRSAVAGGPG